MKKPLGRLLSAGRVTGSFVHTHTHTHTRLLSLRALVCLLCLLCLLLPGELFAQETTANSRSVRGIVKDESGQPLPGATVVVKGNSSKNAIADENGRFVLEVDPNAVLEVSFLGYAAIDYPVNGRASVEISMDPAANRLKDVVVIGNIERRTDSFTGSASVVSGSQLKQIGSANVVESLKSLDPSFVVLENIAAGANPNVLPTIEVRGQTAINTTLAADDLDMFKSDPNQPLFILDGFETDLQKIIDIDFNRVESVQLLKDAASTAFYGSRAANGVLVVNTVQAEPGRFKVVYNGDYRLQLPDLTSYNMMNAQEKLEFEWRAGKYRFVSPINSAYQAELANVLAVQYMLHQAEVARGVDTYWLSEPLNAAFSHRQSVRVSGGSKELLVDAGVSYQNTPGVMKASGRETWTSNLDLTYNKGSFSIVNRLGLDGYSSDDSPYGDFQTWASTNPYYRKTNADGGYDPFLDEIRINTTQMLLNNPHNVPNPLYNASLNSRSGSGHINVDERLLARWNFYKGMRLEGQFQLTTATTTAEQYISPQNTRYLDVEDSRRGLYQNTTGKNLRYVASLMYAWVNNIDVHSYALNVRGDIEHKDTRTTMWSATGFPVGTNGNPSFAKDYIEGVPGYKNTIARRANFLTSVNYSYDNRYLFDATFRLDGTTAFGSARKFTPFWSTGLGWNLHNEGFMKSSADWLTQLRLRATVGQTGNQNLDQVLSSSVYGYVSGSNMFGPGTSLTALGNSNVEWQKTTQYNLGLDMNLFNSLLIGRFEVYQKYTDPLVVMADQAPSTGVVQYPMSMGNLTYRGFEFDLTAALIRSTAQGINWRIKLMGAMLDGWYDDFNDRLAQMNQALEGSASLDNKLRQYKDGNHPKTLWAVPSLGIDPATGREMYLDRFYNPTYVWDVRDRANMGVNEPVVQGTISSFFTWKQLTFTMVMRYSLGNDLLNTALYEKVEGMDYNDLSYNQDKRALTQRWKEPGDIAQFKAIDNHDSTPLSSRFIQTEHYLSGESIALQYRFDKNSWIRHAGLERLDLNATMAGTGGVFRLSNIQRERGTSYPEAWTVALSISAAF